MLENTFCHLPGIGPKKEALLWESSVNNWGDFLASGHHIFSSPGRRYRSIIEESISRLAASDPVYFARALRPSEHWRLFPHFRDKTAYIDIETNGLMGPGAYITTIALYDGRRIRHYVNGLNLEDFRHDIAEYQVLVTYNGKCFDVPFIEADLGVRMPEAHIDLRYIFRGFGFRGGLKGCEKEIGIDRGELDGVDGYFAVLLWNDFLTYGDPLALNTLLAYNIQDTVNLERLMVYAYNRKVDETPFYESLRIEEPAPPELPFRPDPLTIDRVVSENFGDYLHHRGAGPRA